MKLLLLVLLVGLASARFVDVQARHRHVLVQKEGDDQELIDQLKEMLDNILQQIKDKLDEGHYNILELLKKAFQIIGKLKELHATYSDKAKELLDKIKEHFGKWWDKFLEILGLNKKHGHERLDLESLIELLNLKEVIEHIKEMIAEHYDIDKIKEYINAHLPKLEKIREALLEAIEKGGIEGLKHFMEKLKDIFTGGSPQAARLSEEDIEQLREILDNILQQIKDKLDEGHYNILELLKNAIAIINKLKEVGASLGNKAKELIEKIKEHFGSFWNKLLEILGLNKRHGVERLDLESLIELLNLKEVIEHIKEMIKDHVDIDKIKEYINEHLSKLQKIREALLEAIEKGGMEGLKHFIEKLKEIFTGGLKSLSRRARAAKMSEEEIKEMLENVLQQIKDMLDQGHYNILELLKKAVQLINKLKEMHANLGEHLQALLEKIKEHFGPFWSKLLELLGLARRPHSARLDLESLIELLNLKEVIEHIKEMIKDHVDIDKIKEYINEHLSKLQKIREALLEAIEKGGMEGLKHFIEKLKEIFTGGLKSLNRRVRAAKMSEEEIKEMLENVLQQIKDMLDQGHYNILELLKKAIQLINKLKEMHANLGEHLQALLEKIKEHFGPFWSKLLELLGLARRPHSARLDLEALIELLNLKEVIDKVKEMLDNHVDLDKIKEYINQALAKLGKIREAFLEAIEKGGVEGLKHFIAKLKEILTGKQRGIKELWDKITNFFSDLGLNLKEQFRHFSKFVMEHWNSAMDGAKDKIEKIKLIAEEFIEHNKQLHKEVLDEALEFFQPYKEQLGQLWKEIVDIVHGRDKLKLH